MKDIEDVIPKSVRGSEAYKYMKARKKDAQKKFDEAAKFGANLTEALRYAGPQIRAALLGKRIYEAELLLEGRLEEPKKDQKRKGGESEEPETPQSMAERLWGEMPEDLQLPENLEPGE
jgi:hypothetical protein